MFVVLFVACCTGGNNDSDVAKDAPEVTTPLDNEMPQKVADESCK